MADPNVAVPEQAKDPIGTFADEMNKDLSKQNGRRLYEAQARGEKIDTTDPDYLKNRRANFKEDGGKFLQGDDSMIDLIEGIAIANGVDIERGFLAKQRENYERGTQEAQQKRQPTQTGGQTAMLAGISGLAGAAAGYLTGGKNKKRAALRGGLKGMGAEIDKAEELKKFDRENQRWDDRQDRREEGYDKRAANRDASRDKAAARKEAKRVEQEETKQIKLEGKAELKRIKEEAKEKKRLLRQKFLDDRYDAKEKESLRRWEATNPGGGGNGLGGDLADGDGELPTPDAPESKPLFPQAWGQPDLDPKRANSVLSQLTPERALELPVEVLENIRRIAAAANATQ